MSAPPIIEVDGLHRKVGRRPILHGVSFQAGEGVIAVLGPNGAGKTTLLRTLATVDSPDEGEVRVLGADVRTHRGRSAIRPHLGYVPQAIGYYPHFTVAEFVEYIALLKGVPRQRVNGAVTEALSRVDLSDHAKAKLGSLSGGMLRRAGIAQAIVNDPRILIMDEPSAGLDPRQRTAFRTLIDQLRPNRITIISTHLVEDAAVLADHVLVLDRGTIGFDGPTDALVRLAGHAEVTPENLGAGFDAVLEGRVQR